LRIGKVAEHQTNAAQVAALLSAAERGIADAGQESISLETRFDAAYRAIMQLAMLALWANGYRPSKSVPGHHQKMIQSLVHSAGVSRDSMLVLDALRVKRNSIDYTGAEIDEGSVEECVAAARHLLDQLRAWLAQTKPELLG